MIWEIIEALDAFTIVVGTLEVFLTLFIWWRMEERADDLEEDMDDLEDDVEEIKEDVNGG